MAEEGIKFNEGRGVECERKRRRLGKASGQEGEWKHFRVRRLQRDDDERGKRNEERNNEKEETNIY